jgi:hypothetical protein
MSLSEMLIIFIALCIEWCKARAKATHWSEEVTLLMEEMQQVKQFLDWQASWWDEQADRWDNLESAQREGIAAYARWQVAVRREMCTRCEMQWWYAVEWVSLGEVHDDVDDEQTTDADIGEVSGDFI